MYVRFKYFWRPQLNPAPPATVVLNNRPVAGKGPTLKLPQKWIDYCYQINSERAARYLLRAKSGWVNALAADGTPLSESLTMAGNIGKIIDERTGFFLVQSLDPGATPPDPDDRLLVHKFTCVTWSGTPRLPADGMDVYYPFLLREPGWVSWNAVECFETRPEPLFPSQITPLAGYAAVIIAGAVIRQQPRADANKIDRLCAAINAWVTDEVNGWARIGYKQYVELRFVRRV